MASSAARLLTSCVTYCGCTWLLCGLLSGLAGAYIAIAQNAGFSRDMTAGQGFIALAAVIFGRWSPRGAIAAALLFGFTDELQTQLTAIWDVSYATTTREVTPTE